MQLWQSQNFASEDAIAPDANLDDTGGDAAATGLKQPAQPGVFWPTAAVLAKQTVPELAKSEHASSESERGLDRCDGG